MLLEDSDTEADGVADAAKLELMEGIGERVGVGVGVADERDCEADDVAVCVAELVAVDEGDFSNAAHVLRV